MKFDANKFSDEQVSARLEYEPYDYEKYLAINPTLTKRMYNFLYDNRTLWKVLCGKEVRLQWTNDVLKAQWWLDTEECYCRRNSYGFKK